MFKLILALFATAHAAVNFEEMIRHRNVREASAQLLANAQNVLAHVERVNTRALLVAQLPSLTTRHSGRALTEEDAECQTAILAFIFSVTEPCRALFGNSSTSQEGAKAYCEDVTVEGKSCVAQWAEKLNTVNDKCITTGALLASCANKTTVEECDDALLCMMNNATGECVPQNIKESYFTPYVELPCVKDSEEYCYPLFRTESATKDSISGTYAEMATQLEELCVDCYYKIVNVLAQYNELNWLIFRQDLMCMKRNNQWCHAIISSAGSTGEGKAYLDNLCHPCTRAYHSRLAQAYTTDDIFGVQVGEGSSDSETFIYPISSIDLQCQKDPNGNYCLVEIQTFFDGQPENTTASCEMYELLKADVGCCAGNVIDLIKSGCDVDDPESQGEDECVETLKTLNLCDAGLSCRQEKYFLVAKLLISGLTKEFYVKNTAAMDMKIKQMIAFNLDAVIEDITKFEVKWTTGGITRRLIEEDRMQVNFELEVASKDQADASLAQLKLAASFYPMALSNLDPSAYTDPEADPVVNIAAGDDSAIVKGGDGTNSGAASLAPLGLAVLGGLACL